jgi:hypothetical protein
MTMMMNTVPLTTRIARNEGFLASLLRIVWPDADHQTLHHDFEAALPCCTVDATASVAWATDYGAVFYAMDIITIEDLVNGTTIDPNATIDHDILLQVITQKFQQCASHSIAYQVLFTACDPALFDHPLVHRYYDRLRFLPPYHSGYRAIKAGDELALLPPRIRMELIDDEGNRVQVAAEGF